jgi:hypothetical protein
MKKVTTKPRWLLLTVASLALILAGCVQVEVVDRAGLESPALIPGGSMEHNLSATGIVFEPPLDEIGRSVLRQGVELFVEVQNNGLYDEGDVEVQVTLQADAQAEPLAEQQTVIPTIAPGETESAYFHLTELVDLYSHYVLLVTVVPCAGETFQEDNQRTFDLYLTPVP